MNEAKYERDVINNEQEQKTNPFTEQESVQKERLMVEEEVKNGADFWNNDTEVTI